MKAQSMVGILAGALVLGALAPRPAFAGDMFGKAALIVRDAATGQPLPGVSLRMRYVPSSPIGRKHVNTPETTGTTDAGGYAEARVYVGQTAKAGQERRVEIGAVGLLVEKSGYQRFEGVSRVFYIAMRKGEGTYVFLDEVLLSPDGQAGPSRTEPQRFRPEAVVEPGWGVAGRDYEVRVRIHHPAVLAHEFNRPLLHVFVHAMDGVVKLKSDDKGYRSELIELGDDGQKPDRVAGDGEFTGTIRHGDLTEAKVIDHLHIVLRAAEPAHWLFTAEGYHVQMVERKDTNLLLGRRERQNTLILTLIEVPVKWAVAPDEEAARQAYERRFLK